MRAKGTIGKVDKLLDFGEITLGNATTTYCENIINLAKTDAGGMAVHIGFTKGATGGTNATFTLEAGVNNSAYKPIATSGAVVTANMKEGDEVILGIPRDYVGDHLKVSVTTTGNYTAGTADVWLDPYVGK